MSVISDQIDRIIEHDFACKALQRSGADAEQADKGFIK